MSEITLDTLYRREQFVVYIMSSVERGKHAFEAWRGLNGNNVTTLATNELKHTRADRALYNWNPRCASPIFRHIAFAYLSMR